MYNLLTTIDALDTDATSDLIWHKQVPLKVCSGLAVIAQSGADER
jgi:hypothetical protein